MAESPIILLGIWDVHYLEAGIRNFKVNSGRDSGLKVSAAWDAECRKLRDYGIERKFAMGYPGWQRLFMRSFWFRWSLYGNPLRRSCRRFCRPASDTKASRYTRDSLRSKRFRSSYCTKVGASGWLRDDGIEGSIKALCTLSWSCHVHSISLYLIILQRQNSARQTSAAKSSVCSVM